MIFVRSIIFSLSIIIMSILVTCGVLLIFPAPPGTKRRYKIGGAVLAAESGYPVVPVAHNAGHFWPKGRFLKPSGTIRMVIGPPIDTAGKQAEHIIAEAESWIEGEMAKLDHA